MADGRESEDVSQLLEEESAEEEHFRLAHQSSAYLQPGASIGLVHSPTTDTLDSVYLDAQISDSELTESSEIKLDEKEEKIIEEKAAESVMEDIEKVDDNIQSPDMEEKPMNAEVNFETLKPETVDIDLDGISLNLDKDETDDFEIRSSHEIKADSQPSLTKYFGSANNSDAAADDFFSSFPPVGSEKGELTTELTENDIGDMDDLLDLIIDDTEPKDTSKDVDNKDETKVSRLSQHEPQPDAESVLFEMTEDMEETSLPVEIEDDKEDFESFTAETMDTETMDALGMSPAATSFMTERTIHDYFRQGSQVDSVRSLGLDRQLSSSSGTSTKTGLSQEQTVFPTSLEESQNIPNMMAPELATNQSQPPTPAHKVASDTEIRQEAVSEVSGVLQATTVPSGVLQTTTVPSFESPAHVPVLRQRKDSQKSETGICFRLRGTDKVCI